MSELTEWNIRYRPKTLDRVEGNEAAVSIIKGWIASGNIPHFILFTGRPGSGKTTLARIIKTQLGCGEMDFREINASMFRGIDTARDLQRNIRIAPAAGPVRVILLDECFAAGTLVETDAGPRKIEDVRPGSMVRGVGGLCKVKKHFTNVVWLNRICRVGLSDGRILYTTSDHLFLTKNGWLPASSLKGLCILSIGCYSMGNENTQLPLLQTGLHTPRTGQPKVLLEELRWSPQSRTKRARKIDNRKLPLVRQAVHSSGIPPQDILLNVLCLQEPQQPSRISSPSVHRREESKPIDFTQESSQNFSWQGVTGKEFYTYETQQPILSPRNTSQNSGDERSEGNTPYLAGGAWGQREDNHSTEETVESLGQTPVGAGVCSGFGEEDGGASNQLQNRYWQPGNQSGNRGRWDVPQIEIPFANRHQEDGGPCEVRVESVEVYKRGSNDGLFRSCIGDQELLQGFACFHDLEIEGHPSYTANGVVVHNCQSATRDAQEALLKVLEEPPAHVYFILCTTDPLKLTPALRNRATEVKTEPLNQAQADGLLGRVLKKEGVEFKPKVIDLLIEGAEGCARQLLVNAQKVAAVPEGEREAVASAAREMAAESIDLCRALLKGGGWPEVARILAGLKGEPETIRRGVLGYCKSVLLKEGTGKVGMRAYLIMDCFSKDLFATGAAGLVYQAFEATTAKE